MALPATDDFNRTNAATLGSNWSDVTQHSSGGTFAIVSNRADYTEATSGDVCVRWNADTFGNDQYSELTVATATAGSYNRVGPAVRISNSAATYYSFRACADPAGRSINRVSNGTVTELTADSTALPTTPFTMRLEVSGSNLTAYINDVSVLTATDSNIASGYAGIAGRNIGQGYAVDDWEGGDLAASGPAKPKLMNSMLRRRRQG